MKIKNNLSWLHGNFLYVFDYIVLTALQIILLLMPIYIEFKEKGYEVLSLLWAGDFIHFHYGHCILTEVLSLREAPFSFWSSHNFFGTAVKHYVPHWFTKQAVNSIFFPSSIFFPVLLPPDTPFCINWFSLCSLSPLPV